MRFDFDFDAAIFDMDGTLLDTMRYWRYTALEYILAHQLPLTQGVLERMYGTSSRRLLLQYAQEEGLTLDRERLVPELEAYMNRHYLYDARIKGSSRAFLEALRARSVRACVATGSPREYARNGLGRLGLLGFFEFVTDNYEGPFTKDQPGYFEWVVERLGVPAGRCWVFEDALYAMEAAKAAGLRVCAIEEDTQIADRPAIKVLADVYIRDYRELLEEA